MRLETDSTDPLQRKTILMTASSPNSLALQDCTAVVKIDALFVGPWQMAEFATAGSSLEQWQSFPQRATIEQACESLSQLEVAPELILLAQPLPSAIRQSEVDRLQQLAPLARIVVVAGTWCEGELRTGQPLRGVLRLYWYELAPWWQAAERRLAEGMCPSWSQPLDHYQSGRYCDNATVPTLPGTVAVDAADHSVFAAWADSIQQSGGTALWAKPQAEVHAAAGIWDGGQLGSTELVRLREFCAAIPGNVVALVDFPRVEHIAAARDAGAAAVFGKPYVVEEVLAALS